MGNMTDDKITIEEIRKYACKFLDDRDWRKFHSPKNVSIAITTEASELLEIFRFKSDEEIEELLKTEEREKVEDELSDIFLNVLRFSEINNIDLASALENKIIKSEKKYPVEKCKGKNKKYNEYN